MNRGHETPDHRRGKALLGALFALLSLSVMFEYLNSDVVGSEVKGGKFWIVAGEYERSLRNVLRNVLRNFRNGCDRVLIMTPDTRLQSAIRRKLKRHLPRSVWTRVAVITVSSCQAAIGRRSPRSMQTNPRISS